MLETGGIFETVRMDSLFVSGTLMLPAEIQNSVVESAARPLWLDGAVIFFTILAVLNIGKLINVFPSLIGCLIRWKEALNLENSVKLVRDRNFLFFMFLLPFCLFLSGYDIFAPSFLAGVSGPVSALAASAAVAVYFLLRKLLYSVIPMRKTGKLNCRAAYSLLKSVLIFTTLLLSATAAVLSLADVDKHVISVALINETAAFYIIFIIRDFQIFSNFCSYFRAFLYLCVLEIFPLGVLVLTAMFF